MDDQTIIDDLKLDEGFSSKPYRDTEGLLTIGYGTLIEGGITKEEAELLLRHRLMGQAAELLRIRPDVAKMPDQVQRAIINMAYNLGVPRLMQFKKMWAALDAGDYGAAADEAEDSRWHRQVGTRGERVVSWIRSAA